MDGHQVADPVCGSLVLLRLASLSSTQDTEFVSVLSNTATATKPILVQETVWTPRLSRSLNVLSHRISTLPNSRLYYFIISEVVSMTQITNEWYKALERHKIPIFFSVLVRKRRPQAYWTRSPMPQRDIRTILSFIDPILSSSIFHLSVNMFL